MSDRPFPFTEGRAVCALARYFDWSRNMMFPNVHFCGGEMDLAVVTRSRYLWEVEIKRTLADWRADEHKDKWSKPVRRYVSRFYYAVPPKLQGQVPAFVPPEAGLLVIDGWHVREVRTARRRVSPKLTHEHMHTLLASTYNRFWRQKLHRLNDANRARATTGKAAA